MGKTMLEHTEPLVYKTLDRFFHHYVQKRDVERALDLISDQVYIVGIGENEVAIGKQAFRQLTETRTALLPIPVTYAIHNYAQVQRTPGCWDCFCLLELHVVPPSGVQVICRIRLTAGLHREGERYLIDVLHVSQASQLPGCKECFPLKFISQGMDTLSSSTRQELLELIGQIMPGGILGWYAKEGFPLYVANEQLLHMAGYDSYQDFEQDIQGLVLNSIHPDDRDYIHSELMGITTPGDQYEVEYRMKRKDGSYFWVHDIGRLITADDGQPAIISILTDISNKMNAMSSLEQAAATDPLTGIYNRKAAKKLILHLMQTTSSYLFLMMDLDNFKLVNDIYGHKQGDQVLCGMADLLTKSFRKTDVVCRLGGDEFAVFVPDCEELSSMRDKIQALISSYQDMILQHWPAAHSSLSVGGVWGCAPRSFSDLYQFADEMLYQVKKHQKGQLKIRTLD